MPQTDPDLKVSLTLTIAECVVITDLIQMMIELHENQETDVKALVETTLFAMQIGIAETRHRILISMDRAEAIEAALHDGRTINPH